MSNLLTSRTTTESEATRLQNVENALAYQEVVVTIATATAAVLNTAEQIFITYVGATSLTLAAPVAGTPGIVPSGQDGQRLFITDTTGYAHVITTTTNGFNKSKHIATFAGVVGSTVILVAYNGSWWIQASSGITLT